MRASALPDHDQPCEIGLDLVEKGVDIAKGSGEWHLRGVQVDSLKALGCNSRDATQVNGCVWRPRKVDHEHGVAHVLARRSDLIGCKALTLTTAVLGGGLGHDR
jgi:hypothetical protein